MIIFLQTTFARIGAIFYKELLQMRRDRLTLVMMIGIPIMQLILFGFVVNLRPHHLPLAIHAEEESDITRGLIATMVQSGYFRLVDDNSYLGDSDKMLQSGQANFVLNIPLGFSKALVRGERPTLLLEADGTDPAAASAAGYFPQMMAYRLNQYRYDPRHIPSSLSPVNAIIHYAYNPQGVTYYNIVPGLLGVIITMTAVMMTAITITKERERGTMENLLAMPVRPYEMMIGKVAPYIGVGLVQSLIILITARWLFAIPFVGHFPLLVVGILLFLLANLTLGFTFSTIAQSQLQALQLTFFFFLPSMMLSGFMFPFRGMPVWAQYIGEILPLTHFLRIIRGIMLKGANGGILLPEFFAIGLFLCGSAIVAVKRYRVTL